MIPILYNAFQAIFSDNGIGGLPDATACTVTEERNGEYYLEMTYPISGLHYSAIAIDRIILATPSDGATPQPFRIVHISRPIDGLVTIEAQHLSYETASTIVTPLDITSKYSQDAFDALESHTVPPLANFTFYGFAENATPAHFSIKQPTSLRSAIGGMEGSVLDLYGGELAYDKWEIKLVDARGSDSGVTIEYGKNMTAITADTDARSLITGAIAFAKKNDEVRVGAPAYSSNADLYAYKRMKILDLSGDADELPTVSQLTAAAQQYVAASSVGKLETTIEVSFVPLWQTANANKLAQLQRLHLCDTVTVIHPGLRIKEKAKVVRTVYDVLRDRYESITVGTIRRNVADTISSLMSSSDSVSKLDTADRIVEIGTSGIWTYRKWASGIVECWGTQSYSNISVSTAWGSVYESAGQKLTFPAGLFTAAPEYCSITYGGGSSAALSIEPYGLPTKTDTQTFCLTRASADTITNAKVQVHAIGRWK